MPLKYKCWVAYCYLRSTFERCNLLEFHDIVHSSMKRKEAGRGAILAVHQAKGVVGQSRWYTQTEPLSHSGHLLQHPHLVALKEQLSHFFTNC